MRIALYVLAMFVIAVVVGGILGFLFGPLGFVPSALFGIINGGYWGHRIAEELI